MILKKKINKNKNKIIKKQCNRNVYHVSTV